MVDELFGQFRSLLLAEFLKWLAGHVCEGALAEVRHDTTLLIERIPEATCPVLADSLGLLGCPFPSKHALARAANGIEQQNGVWVGSHSPVIEDIKLRLT